MRTKKYDVALEYFLLHVNILLRAAAARFFVARSNLFLVIGIKVKFDILCKREGIHLILLHEMAGLRFTAKSLK